MEPEELQELLDVDPPEGLWSKIEAGIAKLEKKRSYDREHSRTYRLAHPEKARAASKKSATAWQKAHPDKANENRRAWRKKHPEADKERSREFRVSNPDKAREKSRNDSRKHRALHPATEQEKEVNRVRSHKHYINTTFGISVEEYHSRLALQGNKCALCGEVFYGEGRSLGSPVLDHNHNTGNLREFLHKKCNVALGLFEDSAVICNLAVKYLEKHSGEINARDCEAI